MQNGCLFAKRILFFANPIPVHIDTGPGTSLRRQDEEMATVLREVPLSPGTASDLQQSLRDRPM